MELELFDPYVCFVETRLVDRYTVAISSEEERLNCEMVCLDRVNFCLTVV